jgi:anaerobic magnesium-protoporphyrin IX monomethyl ester cyclase
MNVLLIKPQSKHMLYCDLPEEVDSERGLYPPLGLMYVASHLRENSDVNVKMLDMVADNVTINDLHQYITKIKPDIVAIQSITYTIIDTIETANKIKEIDNSIKIVIGGIHATIYPEETANIPSVDYVINGEGERVFTELVKNIDNPEKLKEIKGLAFKEGDKIINNGRSDIIQNIDELPFPARDLLPYKKYYSVLAKRSPLTTMITSKGCPNQCVFCDRPILENKFRPRSPKNVVDEMEACTNLGIHEFSLYDDTFTINKKRAMDICDEIIKRKLDIGWDARARVNTVDKEILTKMKKAGCDRVYYGVESGDANILKVIKKNITLQQVETAFKITKKIGIQRLAYFMIGLPTEKKENILRTIKFAKKIAPDYAVFSLFTPLPETEAYNIYLEKGLFKDYWREFAKNPTSDFKPKVLEDTMTKKELMELLKYAYKYYYLNPKYILKRILSIKSFDQLKTQAKAGLNLLKL